MILEMEVKIKAAPRFFHYYEEKGYSKEEDGTYIVKNEDLPKHSGYLEKRICDICGKEFQRRHEHHVVTNQRYEGKDVCGDCYRHSEFAYQHKVNKARSVFMEKYGKYPAATPEGQEAIKKAFEKYEGGHPMKDKKVKNKFLKTMNDRYGGNSPLCSEEVRRKRDETMYKEGTVQTSSQQVKVHNRLSEIFPSSICELNYPCSALFLDIMLEVEGTKIDVEYDGSYWHKGREKEDRKRDEVVKSLGYKILRIKTRRKIPSVELLKERIDFLLNSSHRYTEIILDDFEQETN